uniref:NAD(+) hydrolase SARM1 n=1 Tax=Petromyzon marinus TaxID=7757 RepID=A0AAJ7TT48_PETMA|nr:sterile alpha and TIR motif-containing protein 1 [Petromyzon marinus]
MKKSGRSSHTKLCSCWPTSSSRTPPPDHQQLREQSSPHCSPAPSAMQAPDPDSQHADDGRQELERLLPRLVDGVRRLKELATPDSPVGESDGRPRQEVAEEEVATLAGLEATLQEAWATPVVGREVATELCSTLRLQGGLELLLSLLASCRPHVRSGAAELLQQVLTTDNREWIARFGLGAVLGLAKEREDTRTVRATAAILQHMFKNSEETCSLLVCEGGLDAVLFWCRLLDVDVLRDCAAAIANCAMYGGPDNHRRMVDKKAAEWLFPLVFSADRRVRLSASLAIAVLVNNKEVQQKVLSSGTLELVEPFIASLDPEKHAQELLTSRDDMQGRTVQYLQQLLPLLDSSRVEPQCVAAFYFCVEAMIKTQQQHGELFQEIGVVQSLKRLVSYSSSGTACRLAHRTLTILGEEPPVRLPTTVPSWRPTHVQAWLRQVGFCKYAPLFQELQVDGDLLLLLSEQDLSGDFAMKESVTRRRFLRELAELKTYADYSACDGSKLCEWLNRVGPGFRRYTYGLLRAGVTRPFLAQLTDAQLTDDCCVDNGVHRATILTAAAGAAADVGSPVSNGGESPASGDRPDVFISYRRATGSQMASLLKVHLQLHGFSAFLDVEKLTSGKFEEKLLASVRAAQSFLLVLTPKALDKCMQDVDHKDWVHKEIVTALQSKKNIVPVYDKFEWPDPSSLPEDMRGILKFNGIKWSHEYQDATIEKIVRFLKRLSDGPLHGMGASGGIADSGSCCCREGQAAAANNHHVEPTSPESTTP